MNVQLIRVNFLPKCTLGYLFVGGTWFRTLERPWRNNKRNKSCIPAGMYKATYLKRSASGKFKDVYLLHNVPDRSGILIHNGNLVSHTKGCILLGTKVGKLNGQPAVLNSRSAKRKFIKLVMHKPIELEIF